jgi:hypothetical protein
MRRWKRHWKTWILVSLLADSVLFVASRRIFAAGNVTITSHESLSSLDGSALDADGSANGIFTVGGNLTLLPGGAITCETSPASPRSEPCPIRIAVGGNLEMRPGSAILAENGVMDGSPIELAVAGNFSMRGPHGLSPGARISSSNVAGGSAGNISIFVTGAVATEPDSRIAADAALEAGEISITGRSTDVRGGISSRASTEGGRPGAIAIAASETAASGSRRGPS